MYAEHFHTDPSITDEELTPAVLEELGRLKAEIINAVLPHWYPIVDRDAENGPLPSEIFETLALELEPLTPAFIRALAAAITKKGNF
jgi:hypothetical protein